MANINATSSTKPAQWIENLGIDLNEECSLDLSQFNPDFVQFVPKKFVMRQAVIDVIKKLNELIDENPKASLQENHTIHLLLGGVLDKDTGKLSYYDQYCGFPNRPIFMGAQKAKESWMGRIFQALADQKYIEPAVLTSRGWDIKVLKELK